MGERGGREGELFGRPRELTENMSTYQPTQMPPLPFPYPLGRQTVETWGKQVSHLLDDAVEELSAPHVLDAHEVLLGVVLEELVDFDHVGVLERPQDAHLGDGGWRDFVQIVSCSC